MSCGCHSPEGQMCTHTSLLCHTPNCCGPSEAETSAAFLPCLGAHTGDNCSLSSSSCSHSSCTATPPLPSNALQDCALIQDWGRAKQNRHFVQNAFCFHQNILKVRECMRIHICCNPTISTFIFVLVRKPQSLQLTIPQIFWNFPQTETPVQARHFHRNKSNNKVGSLTLCRSPVSDESVGNIHTCNMFFFLTSRNKPCNLGEEDSTTWKTFYSSSQCSEISLQQTCSPSYSPQERLCAAVALLDQHPLQVVKIHGNGSL